MKIAHIINLRVFAYEREDAAKIEEKLNSLLPFRLEDEKLSVSRTIAQGFHEKKIIIFEVTLEKEKHTSKFLKNFRSLLSDDQKKLLVSQAQSRLDENYGFFIRIDKTKLLDEDRIWITDSGNCVHMKMTVAAYPTNKENALKVVKDWLS